MPDQSFPQFLRETYFEYQRGVYLGEITPPELPTHEHREHPGLVYVSALGFCPLSSAQERSGDLPKLPQFLRENSPNALHNMALGSETQTLLQRALVWEASVSNPIMSLSLQEWMAHAQQYYLGQIGWQWAFTEASVENQDLRICGRMDAVWVDFTSEGIVGKGVEIKYRAGYQVKPKLSDMMQAISYHLITGFEMYLVITNHFDIYPIVEDGEGWSLLHEDGSRYGLYLSREDYHAERERHIAYLDGALTGPGINFLTHPYGWLCGSKKAPTKTKPGVLTPGCPYWCLSNEVSEGQTFEYDDSGLLVTF